MLITLRFNNQFKIIEKCQLVFFTKIHKEDLNDPLNPYLRKN